MRRAPHAAHIEIPETVVWALVAASTKVTQVNESSIETSIGRLLSGRGLALHETRCSIHLSWSSPELLWSHPFEATIHLRHLAIIAPLHTTTHRIAQNKWVKQS
jgi:hypothetical protein